MKHKFLIVAFLVFSLLDAFAIKANAQDSLRNYTSKREAKFERWANRTELAHSMDSATIIADETTLTYTKTGAKIECDNDEIANKIVYAFKEDVKRFGWSWKKDRHGAYKHYQIFVSKEVGNQIKEWAKTKL